MRKLNLSIIFYLLRRILLVSVCMMLISCATYSQYAHSLRDGLLHGDPGTSLAVAEKKDLEHKEIVSSLEKGMLRRMTDDYSGSNKIFEIAKQEIEKLYGISVTENIASLTINDTFRGYEGDRFEQLLLHAFMAMNYIQLERLDDARVEMLQANIKMMEWGDEPDEDAFLRYLEGIIYETLNEEDNALISYRKALIVYQEKGGQHYPRIPDILKKDLLRLLSVNGLNSEFDKTKKELGMATYKPVEINNQFGELVVILNNGLAPIKSEVALPIFSTEVQQNLRVAFPVYRDIKGVLDKPVIEVAQQQFTMETVEDIDALARYSLEQQMPGIMARATARAVVKYNTQQSQQDGSFAGLLLTVTNLATERADTRSWTTLPQEIQLQRIRLPVGEHQVEIQMKNSAGKVVDVISESVIIKSARSSFVIKHWNAPRLRLPILQVVQQTEEKK
jgi:hypothetical protein